MNLGKLYAYQKLKSIDNKSSLVIKIYSFSYFSSFSSDSIKPLPQRFCRQPRLFRMEREKTPLRGKPGDKRLYWSTYTNATIISFWLAGCILLSPFDPFRRRKRTGKTKRELPLSAQTFLPRNLPLFFLMTILILL